MFVASSCLAVAKHRVVCLMALGHMGGRSLRIPSANGLRSVGARHVQKLHPLICATGTGCGCSVSVASAFVIAQRRGCLRGGRLAYWWLFVVRSRCCRLGDSS